MTVAAYRARTDGRYPITLDEIRAGADGLFGETPPQAVLDAAGVDPVTAVAPPAFDPATHVATEGPPMEIEGVWRQTWTVDPLPPPPVPQEVTRRQAKIVLSRAGYLAQADAAIAAMAGQAGEEARIEWADATVFRRDNPLILGIGTALGLPPAAIDQLFVDAAII